MAEPKRAVLLGASNLQLGLPLVLDRLRRSGLGPWEVLAALGHGRSYVGWSRFLFVRGLPGIAGCALWDELARRPQRPAIAVLTDIGSDLLYGAPVERIAAAVAVCLDRLVAGGAEIVLVRLPLARLAALSPLGYRVARSVLYPGRALPWPALLESARALDAELVRLGSERGARLVTPPVGWYGLDPIHVRRRERRPAWEEMMRFRSLLEGAPPAGGASGHPRRLARLPRLAPYESRLFGRVRHAGQPARHFPDGSNLALY